MKHILLTCAFAAGLMTAPAFAASSPDEAAQTYTAVQKGQWGEAEKLLRQGLAQNPTDPQRLLNLAYVLQNTGRADEAMNLYGQVLQLDRNPRVEVGSDQTRAKSLARRRIAGIATTAH